MTCLWDTDVLSEYIKGKNLQVVQRANAYLSQHPHLTFSLITRYEVLRGLRAKNATGQLVLFETLSRKSDILTLTDDIIVLAADVWVDLKRAGQLLDDKDLLIAATALHHGLPLATRNVKHFSRVPGLVVEDWTQP